MKAPCEGPEERPGDPAIRFPLAARKVPIPAAVFPSTDLRATLDKAKPLLWSVSTCGADTDGTNWNTLIRPLDEGSLDQSLENDQPVTGNLTARSSSGSSGHPSMR